MARHVDFDAAWEAIAPSRAAPEVTIQGERVTLPAEQPVALVLLIRQLRDPDTRDALSVEQILGVLRIVYGTDTVDRWVEGGLGRDKAVGLAFMTPGFWSIPDEDPAGEAEAPATGQPETPS